MKRTFFVALVTAGALALSSKGDEPPPAGKSELSTAKEQFLEAETRVGLVLRDAIVQGFLNSDNAPEDWQRKALRENLRPAVEESFDSRQRLQAVELAGLRRRLAEIEQALAAREKGKDAIVNTRIDSLLIGLHGVGAKTMQSFQDNELKTKAADAPLNDPNLGAPVRPSATVVPAVTPVPARFAGEVLRIGQKSEENDGHSEPRQRPLEVGDNVAANEVLAIIGHNRADGKAWSAREVRAPHAGAVAEKNVNVGDVVKPGDILFQIRQLAGEAATGENPSPTVVPFATDSAIREVPLAAEFDLETRERLAQVDLGEAQDEYHAAAKRLQQVRQRDKSGVVPEGRIASHEKDLRRAKAELDRAKVKVEGVARQREAAAKAAVAEAEGERNMAVGMVRAKEGNRDAAEERLQKAEAGLKGATAKRDYEAIQVERIQGFVDAKAVEATLLEGQKQKLVAAEALLAEATSAVESAKGYVKDTERVLEEARAAVPIAEAKLRETLAERDRLLRRSAPNAPTDAAPKPVKETLP